MNAQVPGPPTVISSPILKVISRSAARHVGHLVAVVVKVECRIGAGRRGLLEQHDAVAGLAAHSTTAVLDL
jgi:hypothetical protein